MTRATAAAAMLGLLAACATSGGRQAGGQPGNGERGNGNAAGVRCDATALRGLVGRPAAEVTAQAQRRSGARSVRSYATGDMLTMDLRPDRLNIERDAAGKVVRFSCG